jgi:hypothetical protein
MSLEQWKMSVENAKRDLQLAKERKANFVAKSKENINAQSDKNVKNRMKDDFNRQIHQYNAAVEHVKKNLEQIKSHKPVKK